MSGGHATVRDRPRCGALTAGARHGRGGTRSTARTGNDLSWRKHYENRRQCGERTPSTRGATYEDRIHVFTLTPLHVTTTPLSAESFCLVAEAFLRPHTNL